MYINWLCKGFKIDLNFRGSSLQRRLREREKEMEMDERDRQREKEEIEEIRRRLLEEGHPDPESQIVKLEREQNEHLMPRFGISPSPESSPEPEHRKQPKRRSRSGSESSQSPDVEVIWKLATPFSLVVLKESVI